MASGMGTWGGEGEFETWWEYLNSQLPVCVGAASLRISDFSTCVGGSGGIDGTI